MSKYCVNLGFDIKRQGLEGEEAEFCDGTLHYHNLSYEDLTNLEGALMGGIVPALAELAQTELKKKATQ